MNIKKKIGTLPLEMDLSQVPGLGSGGFWSRLKRKVLLQESVVDSIWNSYQVLERMAKDQDVTERTSTVGRMERIKKLRQMFKGEAAYGNVACNAVVNFNSTFQFANGILAMAEDGQEAKEELKALEHFLDFNDFNEEMGLALGQEGELSGQVLFRWSWDDNEKQVKAWVVPLIETQYIVQYKEGDFTTVDQAILYPGTDQQEEVPGDQVVFIKFRGLLNGSYGVPTPMPCLEHMENIDKGREDLRKIDHLFAAPTPIFGMSDAERVDAMNTKVGAGNWKIGQALILLKDELGQYLEISTSGHEALLKEVELNIQLISAVTDVPVHFLGWPQLLSNRATSTDMFESPVKRAMAEQRIWMGGFEELVKKVFDLINFKLQSALDAHKVTLAFPPIRTGNLNETMAAWLPAAVSNKVSHRTFLEKVGVDNPDKEIEEIVKELAGAKPNRAPTEEEKADIDRAIEEGAAAAEEVA
jgi:hypothetical protein|tara:strand:- start:8677 stop:10089 length:1413 start_codon:yes stop_codon:yes gene_type:complete